ncbi:hypoxanthine-guanine phosphoribosyltransferase [Rozella allomycis CSF55]|uniref:Hypoxanthine phosphoribosyltransferase n=1 Tax=Rozella allomycis (strain CSF55) TaxID=988480 RepID=A0A075AMK3_ROZAC|nr:Hypoxanthine phosphoribosyl transferase domain-containing protein [Rozella allomycis CSF55]RKP20006.1 hypoxanthine-guanine phosphoribosyltransferase [Rozella allomycis CSF55]|eukprot:EPZ30843.1 Hypoxanthine phosphoribosyl transferase domain-containing protein [Rozella allomycis CSF55]
MKQKFEAIEADKVYDKSLFDIPNAYSDSIQSVLIPPGLIRNRVSKLARNIANELPENVEAITLVCVLKGAFRFSSMLMEELVKLTDIPVIMEFIRMKSYHNDVSTGDVQILGELPSNVIKDKFVVVVEDIIDTGKTMKVLCEMLNQLGPYKCLIATLLWKELQTEREVVPHYVGFLIPDVFVIGFGLDYNEFFRDLDAICVINEYGKEKFKIK